MKLIKDFTENEKIDQLFLVNNVTKGITQKGSNYLNIILQDKSGTIEAKKWEIEENDEEIFKVGNIVHVEGDVLEYKSGLQLKVNKGNVAKEGDIDASLFVPSAPVTRQELQKSLFAYIDRIENKEVKRVVEEIVKNHFVAFSTYPAATKNHHEYVSGLMYHTVSMLRVADALSQIYKVNTSFLFGGVILHDVGKTIELSGPILPKYTLEGKLLGHISIITSEINSTCEKFNVSNETKVLLEHMVLAHHGKYEFGSPVLPMTKEAELLHYIDDIDSKMMIIDKALAQVESGEFTNRQYALEDRSFYKPVYEEEK